VHTPNACAGIGTAFLASGSERVWRQNSANPGGESESLPTQLAIYRLGLWLLRLSVGTEPTDFIAEPRMLPQPFAGFGLYTAGTNRSDDLFIYVKKSSRDLPHLRLFR